jgi:hypothetical protein
MAVVIWNRKVLTTLHQPVDPRPVHIDADSEE